MPRWMRGSPNRMLLALPGRGGSVPGDTEREVASEFVEEPLMYLVVVDAFHRSVLVHPGEKYLCRPVARLTRQVADCYLHLKWCGAGHRLNREEGSYTPTGVVTIRAVLIQLQQDVEELRGTWSTDDVERIDYNICAHYCAPLKRTLPIRFGGRPSFAINRDHSIA